MKKAIDVVRVRLTPHTAELLRALKKDFGKGLSETICELVARHLPGYVSELAAEEKSRSESLKQASSLLDIGN